MEVCGRRGGEWHAKSNTQRLIVTSAALRWICATAMPISTHTAATHQDPAALVRAAIELLRKLPRRTHPAEGPGLEAAAILVVDCDNAPRNPKAALFTRPPAPQPGDPDHWASFVRRLCDLYVDRWGR